MSTQTVPKVQEDSRGRWHGQAALAISRSWVAVGTLAQPCACGEHMYSAASTPPGSLSAPKACEVPRKPGGTCSLGTSPVLSELLERAVLPGAETQPVGSYDSGRPQAVAVTSSPQPPPG